mgnify:CR=1 FL=1
MDNITSYAVLSNVFGAIATGQDAKRKAEREAAIKEKERAADIAGQKDVKLYESGLRSQEARLNEFVAAVTSDVRTAYAFMTLSKFAEQRRLIEKENPLIYATIEAKSLGDLGLSQVEKELYDTAKSSNEAAVNVFQSQYVQNLPENDGFRQIIEARIITPSMSQAQADSLKDMTYETAQTILSGYMGTDQLFNVVYQPMHKDYPYIRALRSIKEKPDEYEPILTSEIVSALNKAIDKGESVGNALDQITNLQNSIGAPFLTPGSDTYSSVAVTENLTLEFMKKSLATKNPSRVEEATAVIENVLTKIGGMTSQESQTTMAKIAAEAIGGSFSEQTLKNRNVAGIYQSLVALGTVTQDVAEGTALFSNNDDKNIAKIKNFDDLFSADPKKALSVLQAINGNPTFTAAYENMNASSKDRFEKGIKTAINTIYDNEGVETTTFTAGNKTVKSQRAPQEFNLLIPELYNLKFVKDHIHNSREDGGMNIPQYGTTRSGKPNLPPQGDAPPNIIVTMNGEEVPASPEMIAFATKRGFNSPADMISGNDVYNDGFNSRNRESVFKAMNLVHEAAIFGSNPALAVDGSRYDDIAFGMARLGVAGGRDLMSVVAGNMPDYIPPELVPTGTRGGSASEVRKVLQRETGMIIDLDGVGQQIENNTTFKRNLYTAISLAQSMGGGSKFEDGFRAAYYNLFSAPDSLLNRATGAIKAGVLDSFIKVDDMQTENDYGVSASTNQNRVKDQAKAFLETEWAKANAQLASMYVTLAYDFAKTMDPSGRISERDFGAALAAISGGVTDPRTITIALMESLADRAEQNVFFQQDVFGVTSKFQGDNVMYMPTPADMQRLRALRHFREIDDRMQDQTNIDVFKRRLSRANSYNSQDMTKFYVFQTPSGLPDEILDNPAVDIVEVRRRVGNETAPLYRGKPVYLNVASDNPRILSIQEVRQYGLGSML